MSEERFREVFRRITAETPEPPAFSDLETQRAKPVAPIRLKPWMAAAGAAALVLMVVGVFGLLGGGGPDLAAPDESTIDYIKLEYSATVNPVCEGGEIIDNGGFDEATIEIWGPNSDDLTLMVATFPDGSTERMMIEGDPQHPSQAWSSVDPASFLIDGHSNFREVGCSVGDQTGILVAPPYSPTGMLPLTYLGVVTEPGWWIEGIESGHVIDAEYDGKQALQIRIEHDRGVGITKDGTEVLSAYFDANDPMKFLGSAFVGETPSLGTWRMEVATVESSEVLESSVPFSTEGMPFHSEGDPNPVVTTMPQSDCPVTIPSQGFTPPDGYPATPVDPDSVWFGKDELWTALSKDGTYDPRKSVWWSINFPGGAEEPQPELTVRYTLLNSSRNITFETTAATNAYTDADGWFIIAGLDTQYAGCWEVFAIYKDASLSYIYYNPEGADPEPVVPDVVGMTVERAGNVLHDAGYESSPFDSEDPTYEVCAQEPGAGEEINPGEIIGLRTAPPGGCDDLMGSTDPTSCDQAPEFTEEPAVYFNCGDGEEPEHRPVQREFAEDLPVEAAVTEVFAEMVKGPTVAERDAGYSSFLSEESADALLSVTYHDDTEGVVIDFTEAILVNNASTSNGSLFFLSELLANAFQFEEVRSVEFRVNGSCEAFWEFLQAGEVCNVIDRP